jgi:hypothetical protein
MKNAVFWDVMPCGSCEMEAIHFYKMSVLTRASASHTRRLDSFAKLKFPVYQKANHLSDQHPFLGKGLKLGNHLQFTRLMEKALCNLTPASKANI